MEGLREELVLALEVLVETAVGEAGVAHDRGDRGAGEAFSAHAARGILQNLAVNFGFVFGWIAHSSS